MTEYTNPTDICNRAMQRLGSKLIASGALLTENSKQATQCAECYDKLRTAELRRNVWRFSIRRTILRAAGTALPTWVSTTTYASGAYVTLSGINYVSAAGSNIGNNPSTDNGSHWTVFNGNTSLKVTFTAWAVGTTYGQGAVVTGSDGLLYLSMTGTNLAHDPTTDTGSHWVLYFGALVASAYDSGTSYFIGELVFDLANVIYASTMNGNTNAPSTGSGWVTIGGTGSPIVIPWSAGTGPATESISRNVFVLPNGYLREAPQDPKAGDSSVLGFPSNIGRNDWLLEGDYLTSRDPGPIVYRFAADVAQVPKMDVLFCEGLAARIAYELCETMTNSTAKQGECGAAYKEFMGTARLINGIETSSTQPPLDDWIACRF